MMSSQPPPPPPSGPSDPMDPQEPRQPDPNPAPPTQAGQQGESSAGHGGTASYSQQPGPSQYSQQPGPAQYSAPAAGGAAPLTESEEKTWSILAHLSAPVAALVSVGMLNFVGPLIIWAIYKDRSQKVRHASAGAFNFNLSLWIVYAVLVLISIITLGIGLIVTIPVGIVVWVGSMVIHVLAAIKASNGEVYVYPAQLPVLK